MKQINILNFNIKNWKIGNKNKEKNHNKSESLDYKSKDSKASLIKLENSIDKISKINSNINQLKKNQKESNKMKPDFSLIRNNIDIKEYLEPSPNNYEYDDVIDEDKKHFANIIVKK